ncbi:heme oxygenase-like protein [Amniculicola lignicola CBS 123094]|uniref:Heme oxygenase-like protein n=1 Tax=Amniculicola lignicola CBS 123094 TaxID=1392246 RepID=A0A6A5X1W1_9PLEO|nr:heme oxygenase-like protein [Amniculicola lignicola CBS 123094]
MSSAPTLTSHLLKLNTAQFTHATQSPFLHHAASGSLPKSTISHWLANDRLYMRGYIALTGQLLRILQLPAKPVHSKSQDPTEIRLVDWLVDALVNIRREERFFIDVAEKYGLDLDLTGGSECGEVAEEKKIQGLKRFEALFESLTGDKRTSSFLPWLEGVVVFWATEKVYFEAWSWAKRKAEETRGETDPTNDADGGAMRVEFIPNWTNMEFIQFVDKLETIVNEGVQGAVNGDNKKWAEVCERAEKQWSLLLSAEEAFWPEVE